MRLAIAESLPEWVIDLPQAGSRTTWEAPGGESAAEPKRPDARVGMSGSSESQVRRGTGWVE